MSIIEFRAINPATGEVDGDLYDVAPLRDAFERFASGVTLKFIDEDGTKQSAYPYGRRVEVQYRLVSQRDTSTTTFTPGFGGDVTGFGQATTPGLIQSDSWATLGAFLTLEPSTTTNDGFPMVEVDGVGYTHLLTRDNPVTDYTDTAKSAILEDLITTFTPVRWDSAKVELVDDSAITHRSVARHPPRLSPRLSVKARTKSGSSTGRSRSSFGRRTWRAPPPLATHRLSITTSPRRARGPSTK